MNSHDDKENELQRREREIQEREHAIRLRELEAEIERVESQKYRTSKHQTARAGSLWKQKAVTVGKFFALVVVTIISVKIASWLTGVILIGGIAYFAYMLFFNDRQN
jgi:Flp pilus assembly protein TadB